MLFKRWMEPWIKMKQPSKQELILKSKGKKHIKLRSVIVTKPF